MATFDHQVEHARLLLAAIDAEDDLMLHHCQNAYYIQKTYQDYLMNCCSTKGFRQDPQLANKVATVASKLDTECNPVAFKHFLQYPSPASVEPEFLRTDFRLPDIPTAPNFAFITMPNTLHRFGSSATPSNFAPPILMPETSVPSARSSVPDLSSSIGQSSAASYSSSEFSSAPLDAMHISGTPCVSAHVTPVSGTHDLPATLESAKEDSMHMWADDNDIVGTFQE